MSKQERQHKRGRKRGRKRERQRHEERQREYERERERNRERQREWERGQGIPEEYRQDPEYEREQLAKAPRAPYHPEQRPPGEAWQSPREFGRNRKLGDMG